MAGIGLDRGHETGTSAADWAEPGIAMASKKVQFLRPAELDMGLKAPGGRAHLHCKKVKRNRQIYLLATYVV